MVNAQSQLEESVEKFVRATNAREIFNKLRNHFPQEYDVFEFVTRINREENVPVTYEYVRQALLGKKKFVSELFPY